MRTVNPQRWFLLACLLELALLGAAVLVGGLLHQSAFTGFHWTAKNAFIGALAAGPPLALFWWTLRSPGKSFAEIRGFLETVARPILGPWSWPQVALLSFLAGLGEESLFRGVIQGGLARAAGTAPALILASLLFGACHFVNLAYAIMATVIGLYLGLIWDLTGNLLVPITAHALYDFVALFYFLRVRQP